LPDDLTPDAGLDLRQQTAGVTAELTMKVLVVDSNLVPHRKRLEAALPSDATVHWHDHADDGSLLDDLRDADVTRLDRLLRESDIVVVSAPLTASTEGMIGAEQLHALGPDGVLINVGRGPLVQERALYEALLEGRIRAAAIDVWYRYSGPDGRAAPSGLPFAALTTC
jgi:phosphoglycerate dehydrogenase-like enzyme